MYGRSKEKSINNIFLSHINDDAHLRYNKPNQSLQKKN